MLHAAERVRPLRHLVGPVHDRRLRQARRDELRHDQGRGRHLGLRRREASGPRPQPRLQPGTDSPKARENLPDEFTFTVNSNVDDIYAKVGRGDIEDEVAGGDADRAPPVQRLAAAQDQRRRPHLVPDDEPRRSRRSTTSTSASAVNFVVNREALRKAWGGPLAGAIATHIAPDAILDNKLKGYAPYGSGKGDLAKAKAEMKLSKYDKNHDGICDAKACKNIFTITRRPRGREGAAARRSSRTSSRIGMTLKDRVLKDAYTPIGDRAAEHPVLDPPGLGQGLRRPATRSSARTSTAATIIPKGNANRGLVGITPAHGQEVRRQGQRHRHPERQRGPRQLPAELERRAPRRATRRSTRSSRRRSSRGSRTSGPTTTNRHQQERHAVASSTSSAATTAYAHVAVK